MQTDRGKKWNEIRMRLFKMVSVGVVDDPINQGYDIVSTLMLIVNLIGAFANTFDGVRAQYASLLDLTEEITVAFFALDYALRLVTAKCLYPPLPEGRALAKYMLSAGGIVDLLSFLPFYLPFFFPSGAAAFRLFRVARIFRLFRINAYYDSLNVITEVIVGKRQQLLSSVFIILVLMLGSSLCMYSLEHDAQPEVFKNAFSGVWWSVSTLLTIGYGDIYPITTMGKIFGIFITFLGVGMVAIPTGIISAGFVDQPGDRMQGCCFSCAVRTDQGDDLALVYVEADFGQCCDISVIHGKIFHLKHVLSPPLLQQFPYQSMLPVLPCWP